MAIFSWFAWLSFIALGCFSSKVSSCVCYRGLARLKWRKTHLWIQDLKERVVQRQLILLKREAHLHQSLFHLPPQFNPKQTDFKKIATIKNNLANLSTSNPRVGMLAVGSKAWDIVFMNIGCHMMNELMKLKFHESHEALAHLHHMRRMGFNTTIRRFASIVLSDSWPRTIAMYNLSTIATPQPFWSIPVHPYWRLKDWE